MLAVTLGAALGAFVDIVPFAAGSSFSACSAFALFDAFAPGAGGTLFALAAGVAAVVLLAAYRAAAASPGARLPPATGRAQRAGGVTLAELLVVLAIAAVLLGMAVPALSDMLQAYRLRLAAADFLGAVELARGQALARGQKVLVAPSAATLDWADGWTVFVDRDGDRRPGDGDDIIMRHPPLAARRSAGAGAAGALTFQMNFGSQQGPPYLAYNSAGRGCSHLSSLSPRFGTVTLAQGRQLRRIKINMLGRARLCDPGRDKSNCAGADP